MKLRLYSDVKLWIYFEILYITDKNILDIFFLRVIFNVYNSILSSWSFQLNIAYMPELIYNFNLEGHYCQLYKLKF